MHKKMASDNNDVKSMNSLLIILSLSHDGTTSSDTGELWVVLSNTVVQQCPGVWIIGYAALWIISGGDSRRNIQGRIVKNLG